MKKLKKANSNFYGRWIKLDISRVWTEFKVVKWNNLNILHNT